jgi:hypothetical protein
MMRSTLRRFSLVPCAAIALAVLPVQAEPECKPIHADLVEMPATTGCDAGESSCFLGTVDGNRGLRGTTHFKGDASGTAPSTSPGSLPYSGPFQYRLEGGTITMRETGVTVPGVVAAHQRIVEGTGDYAGATGDFFVNGYRANGIITTQVTGMLCLP